MASPEKQTREERLAAKLRENLHRRKAQARALGVSDSENAQAAKNESSALSNVPPES